MKDKSIIDYGEVSTPKKYLNKGTFAMRISNHFNDGRYLQDGAGAVFSKNIKNYNNKVVLIDLNGKAITRVYHDHGDLIVLTPYSKYFAYEDLIFINKKKDKYSIKGVLVYYTHDLMLENEIE